MDTRRFFRSRFGPAPHPGSNRKFPRRAAGAAGLCLLILGLGIMALTYRRPQPQPRDLTGSLASRETSVSPPRPLPHGLIPFTVSTGKQTGPLLTEGTIDPIDPAPQQLQRVTITVKPRGRPVQSVRITVTTDNHTSDLAVIRAADTDVWVGTWIPDDTFDTVYGVDITASDGEETNSITITIR